MNDPRIANHHAERGQVLIMFALALVGFVAMVGLIIDGGGAFEMRRSLQTVTDTAALAGANDWAWNKDASKADARAKAVAAANLLSAGISGADVTVTIAPITGTDGVTVKVDVAADHSNTFANIAGMPTWGISATGTAIAGYPNAAEGAAPFIFSIEAFNDDGTPKYTTDTDFGTMNGDVPVDQLDTVWTLYGVNVNTESVRQIICGRLFDATLDFGVYIGQQNHGFHTALYSDVNECLAGKNVPVPVVDEAGMFMGWAMFHVTSAHGASEKAIRGYFLSNFQSSKLTIKPCTPSPCTSGTIGSFSTYLLRLID